MQECALTLWRTTIALWRTALVLHFGVRSARTGRAAVTVADESHPRQLQRPLRLRLRIVSGTVLEYGAARHARVCINTLEQHHRPLADRHCVLV